MADICNGGTATAEVSEGGTTAAMAFNNDLTTSTWNVDSFDYYKPVWIQYQLPASYLATSYRMYGAGDRMPRTWEFYGSNNGSSWTLLDTRNSYLGNETKWSEYFTVTLSVGYLYYRWNITGVGDLTPGRQLQIGEFEIEGTLYTPYSNNDTYIYYDSSVVKYYVDGILIAVGDNT
jgi:hypothetical protein